MPYKDEDKKREYDKKWRSQNPEKVKASEIRSAVKKTCIPDTPKEVIEKITKLIMLRREMKAKDRKMKALQKEKASLDELFQTLTAEASENTTDQSIR